MSKLSVNKKLLSTLMLALVLTACKSTPITDAPVPVEDKTGMTEKVTNGAGNAGANTSGIKTVDIDGANPQYTYLNDLNDPDSILSQRSVFFDLGSDVVKSEYRALLEAHAAYLAANPGASIRLLGNTDDRGAREYNLSLGQRRSVAVNKTMNLLGVSNSQIETVSYGEENANTACSSETCYKVDRRVDIVYTSEQ
jgi:peptidoglycan-associated lipoprotein